MASSSVSQDDVDTNFEKNSRRSRIRTARARQINPSGCRTENQLVADVDEEVVIAIAPGDESYRHISTSGLGESPLGNVDHETSPKPILRSSKDSTKRPNKPHHINKGKQQRDRRKLREKRRSTGVVHLASTESTGGSTTGDDEESSDAGAINAAAAVASNSLIFETRKNTMHNESGSGGFEDSLLSNFKVQHSSSDLSNGYVSHGLRGCPLGVSGGLQRRNKSPSDLEADDENDHDSLNHTDGSCSHVNVASFNSKGSNCATIMLSGRSDDHVRKVEEENQRLLSLMEEKDRQIHLLEFKVQQLMRDTLTISEEQSRLQKENSTLLRALSKLSTERPPPRKPLHSNGDDQPS